MQLPSGLRPLLDAIGNQYGARIQVSEVPPGPPVIQTLVAEVYGPDLAGQTQVAQQIKSIFQHTPGVVDTTGTSKIRSRDLSCASMK